MTIREKKQIPDSVNKALAEYPQLLRSLLFTRGIKDADAARDFLNPDYQIHTHDPFLMKDMSKAVERILSAIKSEEPIVIFSDYDADGIPGGVLLHDFFKKIGAKNVSNYIPHRHDEGFGLNGDAIDEFAEKNAKLIITVDCGIADEKEIAHAKSLGIETIVTDHHLPPPSGAPSAYAILDPKQKGCDYPFKELCGAGVAFKLVQALIQKGDFGLPAGWEKWLLDLVGIATLSDMVPLVGENRVFAHFGLIVLRKSPRLGLQKLFRKERIDQRRLTEDDIVFSVTPKLNAASRMGSADVAFRLLRTDSESEADAAVAELLGINNERKGVVGSLVKEVKKHIESRETVPAVIVVGNPNWRPSLLGLVATTLAREYDRPVFLWGRDGAEVLKGSCRSNGRVDVFSLMEHARSALLEHGGHRFSGGFSVSYDCVHSLEATLLEALKKLPESTQAVASAEHDGSLVPDEVTSETFSHIQKLSPFGEGNPKPAFLLKGVLVLSSKKFGKEKNHLEVSLYREKGMPLKAISFFSDHAPLETDTRANVLASLEESYFAGRTELRLRIISIS